MTDNRGMFSRVFILLLFVALTKPTFVMGQSSDDRGDVERPETREEFLTELMQQEKFQETYKACQDNPDYSDPAVCFWDETSPNDKKDIKDALKTYEDDGSTVASEFGAIDLDGDFKGLKSIQGSTGEEKIKNFFKKKLMNALLGDKLDEDGEDETKIVADHRIFYDLYENRVSKNLLEAMSSFCMEAVPTYHNGYQAFIIPEDKDLRAKVRNQYKNLLETSPRSIGESDRKAPAAFFYWQNCIQNIQNTCEQKMANHNNNNLYPSKSAAESTGADWTKKTTDKDGNTAYIALDEIKCPNSINDINEDFKNIVNNATNDISDFCTEIDETTVTVQRACTVSDYMMGARQAFKRVKDIKKKWEDLKEGSNPQVFDGSAIDNGVAVKSFGNEEDENINNLSAVSSEEAIVESGYDGARKEKIELAKECKQNPDANDKCQELLSGNKKELKKQLRSYDMRAHAMKEKIKETFRGPASEEKQKAVLKEEGFKDAEIEEMLENPEEIEKKITDRYDKKRKALVANLSDQIENKTVDPSDSLNEKKEKYRTIQEELEKDSGRLRDLIHFNNVVSAYLDVRGPDGETFRNTASLYKELDSIKDSDSDFAESADRLKEVAQESELKETDAADAGNATLDSDKLNQNFLGY